MSLARPFDDPLPADVRDLDLITFLFFYHDTTYMPVERAEMNRKLYAALKPGGMLVIADHSKPRGLPTCVPDDALTAVRHERKLHAAFELQLYNLISVFAHVVSLHHLRVRIPVHNFNFVVAVLHPDDKGAEVLQWVSQRPTK